MDLDIGLDAHSLKFRPVWKIVALGRNPEAHPVVKIVDDRQDKTTLRSFSNEDGSTAVFGRLDKVFAGRDAAAIHEQITVPESISVRRNDFAGLRRLRVAR